MAQPLSKASRLAQGVLLYVGFILKIGFFFDVDKCYQNLSSTVGDTKTRAWVH